MSRLLAAKGGNVTMLIWLGKQLLEQADKREIREEATVRQQPGPLALTQEDEEFLRRRAALSAELRNVGWS